MGIFLYLELSRYLGTEHANFEGTYLAFQLYVKVPLNHLNEERLHYGYYTM
jgi:hypothetical protein